MKRQTLLILVLLAASPLPVAAGEQAAPTVKEVETLYASDKKLCAEEKTSSVRMQCLRDAKAEYTANLAAAKKAQAAAKSAQPPTARTAPTEPACPDCGKVIDVNVVEKKGEGGALGMIGGGVAGALLGSQVGGGKGKTLATIAGAAGGAYAGKKIEENVTKTLVWNVRVQFDGGEERTFAFDHDPKFLPGDPVRKSGNGIAAR